MENINKITHLFLNKMPALTDKKIICGFSGGADSTALLYTLIQKRDFFGFNLEAVFFSHGDSPIAVDEDKMLIFCKEFCQHYNIPFKYVDLNLEKLPRQGWESSGRKARQNFYKNEQCDYVFLGHHQDDQDETTMIQFMRGGGKGASAMQSFDGFYCRPFLNIHKVEIYQYLTNLNIQWIEDPTNLNTDFTRNFWRNTGLPTIAQHYPQYSQMLSNFRIHNKELNELAYELAINDGLDSLLTNESIDINGLSTLRLKNLINHYFNAKNIHMEDAFYDQQVAHFNSNKSLEINHKGIELNIIKNILYPHLIPIKKNKP
jgi:tRNA(Ile)-lysidine synthase